MRISSNLIAAIQSPGPGDHRSCWLTGSGNAHGNGTTALGQVSSYPQTVLPYRERGIPVGTVGDCAASPFCSNPILFVRVPFSITAYVLELEEFSEYFLHVSALVAPGRLLHERTDVRLRTPPALGLIPLCLCPLSETRCRRCFSSAHWRPLCIQSSGRHSLASRLTRSSYPRRPSMS